MHDAIHKIAIICDNDLVRSLGQADNTHTHTSGFSIIYSSIKSYSRYFFYVIQCDYLRAYHGN